MAAAGLNNMPAVRITRVTGASRGFAEVQISGNRFFNGNEITLVIRIREDSRQTVREGRACADAGWTPVGNPLKVRGGTVIIPIGIPPAFERHAVNRLFEHVNTVYSLSNDAAAFEIKENWSCYQHQSQNNANDNNHFN